MKNVIILNEAEIQSGSSRVDWAEGLIQQLPDTHDGRNSWLMNYGVRPIAVKIRANDAKKLKSAGHSPRNLVWDDETECLESTN